MLALGSRELSVLFQRANPEEKVGSSTVLLWAPNTQLSAPTICCQNLSMFVCEAGLREK